MCMYLSKSNRNVLGQLNRIRKCSNVAGYVWVCQYINSLASKRCGSNFKTTISNSLFRIVVWAFVEKLRSGESQRKHLMINLHWFLAMACCRQVTRHYLSQCWLRSMLPYGVNMPLCIKHDFSVLIHHITHFKCGSRVYTIITLVVEMLYQQAQFWLQFRQFLFSGDQLTPYKMADDILWHFSFNQRP